MKQIEYQSTPEIKDFIATIGRTEDAKFSSDGRFLAIVDYFKNKIHLFEVNIENNDASQEVNLVNFITISSEHFRLPHGFEFLGNEHFVVGNRGGAITIFKLPLEFSDQKEVELNPVRVISGGRYFGKISSPGSIACYQIRENCYRLLVCNNYIHTIVAIDIALSDKVSIKNKGVLIKRGLNLPDGISISPNKEWVAVSNHNTGTVLIYSLSLFLNRFTAPSGVLTDIAYPHGLRFSADGKKIFVTDAGSQYIHIFESNTEIWQGKRGPIKSIKLVDDHTFIKCRINPEEGGLKGLDVTNNDKLLVTTGEHQVLNFYGVNELNEMSISIEEQVLVKEKIQYYRTLEKGVVPDI